jgi:predicted TIM-barrel fold metal-dependent hydrolase
LTRKNIEDEIKKFKLIDSHMHLGIAPNTLYYNYNDDRVMELQKKFNVKISVCSHCISFYDLEGQVREIKKVQDKFGDLIYWNLVYDPKCPEKSIELIDKNRKGINFAGIKIHPVVHETRLDSRLYYPLWDYATANNIVISAHTWSPYTDNPRQFNGNPLLLEGVLKEFPKIKIILGHSGGKINFYDEVINFVKNHENVFMDFSGDCIYPPVYKKVISKAGKGRILFGTDMPMMDIRYHITSVICADIDDSDREDIFFNTAAGLYNF